MKEGPGIFKTSGTYLWSFVTQIVHTRQHVGQTDMNMLAINIYQSEKLVAKIHGKKVKTNILSMI
jgi:hypothetical protein